MGNLLRNIPFSGHVLVLGLIILLRLPTFFEGYFLHSESLYLLCAEKIAEGGRLYLEAWYEGPPVMIWLYSLFSFIFGKGALVAIRVFTLLYLYLTVLYFQGMLVEYKVVKKDQLAPALFLVLLTGTPWSELELTPSLFFLWPTLFSFHVIILLTVAKRHNFRRLFFAGVIMMICLMMDYSAISLLIGLGLAYLMIRQPQVQEFFTLLLGSGVCFILVALGLYFTGSVIEYFDLGVRQYLSQLLVRSAPPFSQSLSSLLLTAGLNWGFVVILAVLGFVHYRLRIYSYMIVIRRVEQTMTIWLLSGLLILFLSGSKLRFHDFIVLAPALAFYAAKAWSFPLPRVLSLSRWALLIAIPIYMSSLWIGLTFPPMLEGLQPLRMADKLAINCQASALYPGLEKKFGQQPDTTTLWVLADKPQLYHLLDMPCGPSYTDFRTVYHKLPYFSSIPLHRPEPDGNIYEELKTRPPDYILEPPGGEGGFSQMKRRFPTILGSYRLESNQAIDGFLIWKNDSPSTQK